MKLINILNTFSRKITSYTLAIMLTIILSGCGSTYSVELQPALGTESEKVESKSTLETYIDEYISFEYDKDLFYIDHSEDNLTITVKCPDMPDFPEDGHNTVLGFTAYPVDSSQIVSEKDVPKLLKDTAQSMCQELFTLNDDETIVNEKISYSDFCAEYIMEISDGSTCYVKILNYNNHCSTAMLRTCTYSKDYNDAFLAIYNSAKSELGNFDLAQLPPATEETIASDTTAVSVDDSKTDVEQPNATETTLATEETINSDTIISVDDSKTDDQQPNTPETTSQKNALHSANSYLEFTAFSYEGLIDQLEYEKFSHEDAIYAADNCGADWNEQALNAAKSYLDFSAFSYSGLIEQLEYEKYTTEQATYAADNCGADWNEQAAKSAESYLELTSFSKSELIEQLKYEGFTSEQAEYGATANGY